MALAFFDVDRTLLSVNAGSLWIKHELRDGRITRWQATKAAGWLLGYHLGYARIERALEQGIATLAEQVEDDVRARTLDFYKAQVASRYRPGARAVVERHRARGDRLVLLTTSSVYLAEPVQVDLAADHVLCNRFEVQEGRFTGRPLLPLCYGTGKLDHARALAEELGEDLATATFYTDSYSDVSVLEAVGVPVAVHPDPRLARIARQRGWRIERWDTPG